ncbi:hypothetical protein ACFX1R_012034 [Malus domestica]
MNSIITCSKIEEAPPSESRKLDSQQDYFHKNRRGTALRISRAKLLTGLLSQKSKRHRFSNLESQIPDRIACLKTKEALLSELREPDFLDKACLQSSHATSAFQIPHTTFSKCSDKVKTREACSSHYVATTKKDKGIALLLVVRETPIYVDLHPPRTGGPAKMLNPSSYLRGHSQRSLSKYSTFFPLNNTYANQPHQRAISQYLESSFQSGTDCLEPLASLLTWHCSRVLVFNILCFQKRYHICLRNR